MTDREPPLRRSGSRFLANSPGAPQLPPLPLPALDGYSAAAIAFAARAWTMRAEEEHRSATVFAELVAKMAALGLPLDATGAVAGTVVDELRHAALCTELATRFGASAPAARTATVTARVAGIADRRAAALALTLVEGAVGETLSSALFNAGRHATVEPCSRAALAHIARDEARHARRFWELLDVVELADADREQLQEEVRRAFAHLERGIVPALQRLEAGEPFEPALAALGVLAPERRVEAFYDCVERAVRPRLKRIGVDGDLAWARRYA
jgi:hypothetical protein